MVQLVADMRRHIAIPVIAKPNAGMPSLDENGKTVYAMSPEEFAKKSLALIEAGTGILGGCCGTTPEHIKKMSESCRMIPVPEVTDKERTVISSYSHAVTFGGRPIIVGERINPTGKSRFKQALREHDLTYILNVAAEQQES